MLGKARIPVRAIHLLNFAIAVLAAYGVDSALTNAHALWTSRLRKGLAVVGALILGAATVAALTSKPDLNKAVLQVGVVSLALAGTLLARYSNAIGRRSAVVILVSLVIIELYSPGTATFANRFDKDHNKFVNTLLENKDVVTFLRNQQYASQNSGGSPVRVEVNDHDIPTNFGDWHGIDMRGGYTAGVTSNLLRLEWSTQRTQSLLGITHSVGREPARPDMEEIFAGESGIKVWRNPDVMPRVWAVHEARAVKHDYEIRRMIQDPDVDLHRTTAILGEAPTLETCAPDGDVKLLRRRTDRLTISATLSCTGMVILAEPYYPGWTATVDDKPARVWEAYGSLRGVVVEKGAHEVKFAYRPLSVYGGAALTALGILLTVIFVRR